MISIGKRHSIIGLGHALVVASLLLSASVAWASGQSRFQRLSDDLVLGQTSIVAFAQDQDGYLWFGTQAGVKRFDGYRFQNFHSIPDDPDSLSHRVASEILVAETGQVWVGTHGGLNRIDPDSGRVTRIGLRLPDGRLAWPAIMRGALVEDATGNVFASSSDTPMRVPPGSDVMLPVAVLGEEKPDLGATLRIDRANRVWLASPNGLWRYDREAEAFRPVLDAATVGTNLRLAENMLATGPGNGVTFASAEGAFIVDPDSTTPIRRLRPTRHGFDNDRVDAVAVDSANTIWLRRDSEIIRIPPHSPETWQRFDQPAFQGVSVNSARLQLAETPDGTIWLAGRFGLARHEPGSGELENFRHEPGNPNSLPQTLGEIGYRIFLDDFGVLWVGANLGGLARLPPQSDRFTHVQDTEPSIVSRNIVRAIVEQEAEAGELVWVSNQNAGITVWKREGARRYRILHHYPPDDEDSIPIGTGRAFAIHPVDESIWIGGSHALGRIRTAGAPLEVFTLPLPPGSITPTLRSLEFIDSTTLLAGGARALWLIDLAKPAAPEIIRRFDLPRDDSPLAVFDILPLQDGRMLVAGLGGLILLNLENGNMQRFFPAGRRDRTPANDLFHLARDSNGTLWAGTRGAGLLKIDLSDAGQPAFEFFGPEDGLPDDTVYAIVPDPAGTLWLSSNRGILRFEPSSRTVRQYTPADNLQSWEFSNTVGHTGESGRLYFGGINGWNVFRPGTVRDLLQPPRIHLQSVSVNGAPAVLADDRPTLPLDHDGTQLVIEYVGLQFADPDRIRYAVRMRGLDDAWIDVGNVRRARYASLAPGRYAFEVKAANLDGIWSSPKQLMQFDVARPPWFRPLAWLLYLALIVSGVVAFSAYQKSKRRHLQQLVDQRTEQLKQQKDLVDRQAGELEQALEARTLLFANVSHEFRTPLTLIRASIEKLEQAPDQEAAALGRKYVNRLQRMVEQLLDLSRLRLARTTESDSPWRLDSVVSQTVEAFRSGVERQQIHIEGHVNGAWHTRCPQNLVEKILLNLISNAVKFTPPGGSIKVSLQPDGENAVICVEDTGSGISEADQAMIFKRFYRARAADTNHVSGAGIGLALVAEAARACGGDVDVASRPGHGTCFWVTLPARRPAPGEMIRPARIDLDRQRLDLEALQSDREALDNPDPRPGPAISATERVLGTVLVVEDNADLREYLARALAPQWDVEQAVDGVRGFSLARESSPDLIITDLMMPNADGFEMLARLREDIETSHIPVLFLTARQDSSTRLKAFTLSADAFLSKPFELDELKARLEQMMTQRERIRAHLVEQIGQPVDTPDEPDGVVSTGDGQTSDLAPRDHRMLDRLGEWLKANSGDSEVDVHAMADAVHLTPRTLQRKLKSLTGRTPAAYLREYRLGRARHLLRTGDDSVTDIAHACGFSSSQYFSRAFREEHGAPPEKWRRDQSGADA